MHDLSSRHDCRQQMGAAHLATSLEVFVMLYNEGCERGLCRYVRACGHPQTLSIQGACARMLTSMSIRAYLQANTADVGWFHHPRALYR